MAVLKKDELLESLKGILGDNKSDEALKILEDASDTITDFEEKTKNYTALEEKYNKLDDEWRTKYRERFFKKTEDKDEPEDDDIPDEKPKKLEFSDLFKEEK